MWIIIYMNFEVQSVCNSNPLEIFGVTIFRSSIVSIRIRIGKWPQIPETTKILENIASFLYYRYFQITYSVVTLVMDKSLEISRSHIYRHPTVYYFISKCQLWCPEVPIRFWNWSVKWWWRFLRISLLGY